ncbi:site-specific integrase [Tardiphaga sp. P9-11]|uniref:tyrosine-type recombinase/integrase n=1 Tax=Tardiphaga sp. P9-11 TaxID=2024614 RepID=UPI00156260C8|nr:site-specific integrase [Tardiphaga sp. P9-11]
MPELIDLVQSCGRPISALINEIPSSVVVDTSMRYKGTFEPSQLEEKGKRLATILSFVEFESSEVLLGLAAWPERRDQYSAVREHFIGIVRGYTRGAARRYVRNHHDLPEGLSKEAVERLRQVIDPNHPENPFTSAVRFRNYVIVRLLLELGMRRGELLGIKLGDCAINSASTITLHRRPDDPEDPRPYKPATKTLPRKLRLSGELAELLYDLIMRDRREIPGVHRHPFLIVSNQDGAAMSLSNINKILTDIRTRVPGLPVELSPHLLRHTWNDEFSEEMDRKKVTPEMELKYRMYLMGWRSEDTAAIYLRRTVRRRANEVLAEMHGKLLLAPRSKE